MKKTAIIFLLSLSSLIAHADYVYLHWNFFLPTDYQFTLYAEDVVAGHPAWTYTPVDGGTIYSGGYWHPILKYCSVLVYDPYSDDEWMI